MVGRQVRSIKKFKREYHVLSPDSSCTTMVRFIKIKSQIFWNLNSLVPSAAWYTELLARKAGLTQWNFNKTENSKMWAGRRILLTMRFLKIELTLIIYNLITQMNGCMGIFSRNFPSYPSASSCHECLYLTHLSMSPLD